jgi:hypothetical protein
VIRLLRLRGSFLIAAIASIAICVTRSLLALDGSITLDQRRRTRGSAPLPERERKPAKASNKAADKKLASIY